MTGGSSDKRFTLVMAATAKNEAPYIAEWIEYHGLIGAEHFYIYDNRSEDNLAEVLEPYIVQGRATLIHWPEFPGQMSAYNHAVKIFGRDAAWMGLVDIDEFIQVEGGRLLSDHLLGLAPDVDQLLLPWVHFGSSGHESRPEGLVIESYVHRVSEGHRQPKSLVRPDSVIWAGVHHCVTRHGRAIDGRGERAFERWILPQPNDGPTRVNHYFTKSRAEFDAKLARGQADGGKGKDASAFTRFVTDIHDDSLAAMGPQVKAALALTRARHWSGRNSAPWSTQSELYPSHPWSLAMTHALIDLDAAARSEPDYAGTVLVAMDEALLVGDVISPDLADRTIDSACSEVGAECLAQSIGSVGPDAAASPISEAPFGKPFLIGHLRLARPATLLCEVEGHDAAGKSWASRRRIELPAGEAILSVILSARTMRVANWVLRTEGEGHIEVRRAALMSFL